MFNIVELAIFAFVSVALVAVDKLCGVKYDPDNWIGQTFHKILWMSWGGVLMWMVNN